MELINNIIQQMPDCFQEMLKQEMDKPIDMDFYWKQKAKNWKKAYEYINKLQTEGLAENVTKLTIPEKYQKCTIENWTAEHLEQKLKIKINMKNYRYIKKQCYKILYRNFIIITGRSSVGKTHLAYSVMKQFYNIKSIKMDWKKLQSHLASHTTFRDDLKEQTTEQYLKELYTEYKLIIIDDLNIKTQSQNINDYLFFLIKEIIERGKYIILISNNPIKEVITSFGYNADKITSRIKDVGGYINLEKLFEKE